MKKLILLFVVVLLAGCSQTTEPQYEATKFSYENHSYIMFTDGLSEGVVHDPDCDCHIDFE